jgi:hypothetical protein
MNRKRPGGGDEAADRAMLSAGGDAGGAGGGGLGGPAPHYVELVTDISGDINAVASRMETLATAHAARLRITFDPGAEAEREREIEILTAEVGAATT